MLNWATGPLIFGWIFVLIWVPIVVLTQRKTHPKALFTLFFAELWERFSFYGMRALLTLYMTKVLFEQMETGKADALAYGIYGAFNALLYGAPVIGGLLADRMLGFRYAVILGGLFMAIGQFTLSGTIGQELPFYIGLGLIIVGNGFFKPNISSFLGEFYERDDPRKDGGFTIFYMGINIGAFLAPLTCGYLGEQVDWSYGFLAAGIGIVLGVIVFWFNMRKFDDKGLPPKPLQASKFGLVVLGSCAVVPLLAFLLKQDEIVDWILIIAGLGVLGYVVYSAMNAKDKVEGQRLLVVVVLFFFHMMFWALFEQAGGSLTILTDRHVNRGVVYTVDESQITKPNLFAQTDPDKLLITAPGFETKKSEDANAAKAKKDEEPKLEVPLSIGEFRKYLDRKAKGDDAAKSTLDKLKDENDEDVRRRAINIAHEWARSNTKVGVPTSQFQSLNPLFIMLLAPVFSWLWIRLRSKNIEPRTPNKFVLGLLQLAIGYAIIVGGASLAGDRAIVPVIFVIGMYLLHTTGELSLSPVGLSVVTKLSTPKVVGFVMGTWFLSIAFAHKVAGYLGKLTTSPEPGTDPQVALSAFTHTYWIWGVLVVAGSAVFLFVLSPMLKRWMHGIH